MVGARHGSLVIPLTVVARHCTVYFKHTRFGKLSIFPRIAMLANCRLALILSLQISVASR